MFDVHAIVDEVHNEVATFERRFGDDEPLAAARRGASLPSKPVLVEVITELLWASTLEEEGRGCRPRLLYAADPLHAFTDEAVWLQREQLRKRSLAHGPRGYLTWAATGGRPCLTGIMPKYENHPAGLILSAPGTCALDVLWHGTRLLTVRSGERRALSSCALPSLRDALVELGKTFHQVIAPELLGPAVQTIVDDAHGGSLWLVAPHAEPHLPKMHRLTTGLAGMTLDDVISRESVGHLAAVDGAVVVDANLRVRGFGAFVESKPVQVATLMPDGQEQLTAWEALGGGRHGSAASFCAANAPAAAIVVSSDGSVTLFLCRASGATTTRAEIVSLGVPSRRAHDTPA